MFQVLEPISFDLIEPRCIRDKANTWAGRLLSLSQGYDFQMMAVVSGPQQPSMEDEFAHGRAILQDAPCIRKVLSEKEVPAFLKEIKEEIH